TAVSKFEGKVKDDDSSAWLKRYAANEWTTAIPNLLTAANLAAVRGAIELDWVFGLHLYYRGGCGPDAVVFSEWQEYLDHCMASRPGDRFILWSLSWLRGHGKLLAEKRSDETCTDDSVETALKIVSAYLERRLPNGECYEAAALRLRDG